MIVKHLRREFYELLFGKRVLIMPNLDVDSVCATKILTELLKVDGVSFSLYPVDGINGLKQGYKDYSLTVQVVIMINCGIGIDIRALLNHPRDKLFFVIDSHRPVHVANYYDETNQIRILSLDDNFEEIPEFDEIFRSDDFEEVEESSDDEESDHPDSDDEDGPTRKRRRQVDRRERRRAHEEWMDKRNELIFNYTQFSYFGPPSSLIALELSWAISRGDMQYVWWTTVALTDGFILEKMPRTDYVLKAAELSRHIARESVSSNTPRDCLKVNFEKELNFYLYRYWNLYESIKMTPYSACVLKTWSLRGESRFHEMLGELGFPQSEVRQKYASMSLRFRKKVHEAFALPMIRDKYKFEDVTVGTFVAEVGFRPKLNAFDCQLACLALLENPDKNKTTVDNFVSSMACLSKRQFDTLDKGIELAKTHLTAVYRQVQEFINMNAVGPRGGFLYAPMPEGAPNAEYFRNPSFLMFLAQFTQRAVVAGAKSRRWATLPLVMTAPHSEGYWSIIGIKPLSFELPKNLFGKLFETLAEKMKDLVELDFLDPHIILVKSDQKEKFLQLLEACMV